VLDTTSVNNQLQKRKRLQFCLLSGSLAFGKLHSQYGGQRLGQRHRYRNWLWTAESGVRAAVGGSCTLLQHCPVARNVQRSSRGQGLAITIRTIQLHPLPPPRCPHGMLWGNLYLYMSAKM